MSKVASLVSNTTGASSSSPAVTTVDQMVVEDLTASLNIVQRPSRDSADLLDVCVSINHPTGESNSRGPADICCVIDVSGSMTSSASVSEAEDAGLSVLDVVKHAVNTITKSLSSQDRLSVVTFSDEARVVFANVLMDDAGKAKATSTVNQLATEGRTNLWAGLLRGMDILHAANEDSSKSNSGQRNSSLFLLTDGVPNVDPSEGYMKAMQRFRDQHGGYYPGSIHTFGFGYSLKSALLNDIATEGNGTYNFIPDSGFVGTAFVNTLASQLTSYGFQSTLSLQLLDDDASIVEDSLLPNGSHVPTSWGVNFNVGTLLLGQKRDFVIQIRLPQNPANSEEAAIVPQVEATLQYRPMFIPQQNGMSITQNTIDLSEYGLKNLEVQVFRTSLVRDLTAGYKLQNSATAKEAQLLSEMEAWLDAMKPSSVRQDGADDFTPLVEYVGGLMKDLSGQIRMAHTQPAHDKWGTHYIPSLRCAHQRQQCNNFKDPGVQLYGGVLFQQIRDMADEVFLSLPPPKPSRHTNKGRGGGSRAIPAAPVNMSVYHNAAAGCFAGCGQVTMMDGSFKLVSEILPGDHITCDLASPDQKEATTAIVECVVRTRCTASQTAEFVEVSNGLLLTPWHPVWYDDKWQFPMDISGGVFKVLSAEYVYNFILGACDTQASEDGASTSNKTQSTGRGQSMVVNGIKCITLAHGIDNDPVASHSFYGTDDVLNALKQYPGYREGLVVMDESHVQRNNETGLVCGYAAQQCESE